MKVTLTLHKNLDLAQPLIICADSVEDVVKMLRRWMDESRGITDADPCEADGLTIFLDECAYDGTAPVGYVADAHHITLLYDRLYGPWAIEHCVNDGLDDVHYSDDELEWNEARDKFITHVIQCGHMSERLTNKAAIALFDKLGIDASELVAVMPYI